MDIEAKGFLKKLNRLPGEGVLTNDNKTKLLLNTGFPEKYFY